MNKSNNERMDKLPNLTKRILKKQWTFKFDDQRDDICSLDILYNKDIPELLEQYFNCLLNEETESASSIQPSLTANDLKKIESDFVIYFRSRIFETTNHPSQLHKKVTESFYKQIKKFRKMINANREKMWNLNLWECVRNASLTIRGETISHENDSFNSKIDSNAHLNCIQLDYLQWIMKNIRYIESFRDEHNVNDFIDNELIPNTPEITDPAESIRLNFDEVLETIRLSKKMIIESGQEIYSKWIDFDGASRPEGIMYSEYAWLLIEDIHSNGEHAKNKSHVTSVANQFYSDFCKIDAIIHALTLLLISQDWCKTKFKLERVMDNLKVRRFNLIENLVKIRNYSDKKQKINPQWDKSRNLSKRIRFLPRLDNKFVKAFHSVYISKDKKSNMLDWNWLENSVWTFEHIAEQVVEINYLSWITDTYEFDIKWDDNIDDVPIVSLPIVPEIMLSECKDYAQIKIIKDLLKREEDRFYSTLNKNETDGIWEKSPLPNSIAFVPLFEDDFTTANVWSYLDSVYDETLASNAFDQEKTNEVINKQFNEIFIAGSDLSKRISHFWAFVRIMEIANVIAKFNLAKWTDIRLKIWTWESVFRQSWYFDTDAFMKVFHSSKDLPENSKNLISKIFWDQYWEICHNPLWLNWLLSRIPQVNGITIQSRAKEISTLMSPANLLKSINSVNDLHNKNFDVNIGNDVKKQSIEDNENKLIILNKAAKYERIRYESFMGKDGQSKNKRLDSLPALIEVIAKKLPKLRDRNISRTIKNSDFFSTIESLSEPWVDARTIWTNTAASLIFPLALIGKSSSIKKLNSKELDVYLHHLPVKGILKEMKYYELIAPKIFSILRGAWLSVLSNKLETEWIDLLECRPVLQEQLLKQVLPANQYSKLKDYLVDNWENKDEIKHILFTSLTPETRELFQDDYFSDKTIAFKNWFDKYWEQIIKPASLYLHYNSKYNELINNAVKQYESKEKTLQQKRRHIHSLVEVCWDWSWCFDAIWTSAETVSKLKSAFNKRLEKLSEDISFPLSIMTWILGRTRGYRG